MKKALIIVDPQNDFCQGGPLGVNGSKQIFPFINKLRKEVNFDKVFITMDWHLVSHISFAKNHNQKPFTLKNINGEDAMLWPVHCIQDSQGAKLSDLLELNGDQIYVKKGIIQEQEQYSGFGGKKYKTQLREKLVELDISQVVVVGLALDYCVGNTALDALYAGLNVVVIQECTKPVNQKTGKAMIIKMSNIGIQYLTFQTYVITSK